MPDEILPLDQIHPDTRNANKGNLRGAQLLESSLRKFGPARSIVLDCDNHVIAGNKTLEQAAALGYESIRVIETDGSELVAVKRTDLSIDSVAGRGLAVADNRTGQVGLEWDADVLKELQSEDVGLSAFWHDNELDMLLGTLKLPDDPRELWGNTPGMPDMGNEANACRQLTIYFKKPEDVGLFSALLDQTVTDNTKSLWYPAKK